MSEGTFSNKTLTVSGLVMLAIIVVAFAWLWLRFPRPDASIYKSSINLQAVNISGIDTKAKNLLDGLTNNGGIPIPIPAEKMGREDPFASL